MPVRRGHVALQNTYLDTIIRKFDGQNRTFLIANAQMKNCGIIYCNEGFCQMFGFSRAEIMQQPCTCQFLVGPGTMKTALTQLAQALLGSEERKVEILYYSKEGTCRPCLIDVVPVKKAEGQVIMFILNFQEIIDPSLRKPGLSQRMAQGWVWAGQSRRLKLRLPLVRAMRRSSLAKYQFEGVVVDYLQPNSEEIPLKEFRIPSKESCMQSETEALIEQVHESPQPASHYSPKRLSLLSERLDPSGPFLPSGPFSSAAFPRTVMPRNRSRETVGSLRRASSLDDIDSMRAESGRPGDPRSNSIPSESKQTKPKLPGPVGDLKAGTLSSTSDSDLMRRRTSTRRTSTRNPLTLSFASDLLRPPSPTEIEIIAPSKVKDRHRDVTEKVTHVTQVRHMVLTRTHITQPQPCDCLAQPAFLFLMLMLSNYFFVQTLLSPLSLYSPNFPLHLCYTFQSHLSILSLSLSLSLSLVLSVGQNDIFGEPIYLFGRPGKSSADVRALTYCDLHRILRDDLLEVLDMYPDFSDCFWTNLEITFNLRDVDRMNQATPSEDSECGYRRPRPRRTRNRPDGMDREDSFPGQSCPLGNHSGPDTSSHWEGMCSSASACSQSSDDEMKPLGHSKAELYPSGDDTDDYPPAVVSLLPPSGPSVGMGPPIDRGSHQYTAAAPINMPGPGVYGYWPDQRTSQLSDPQRRCSSVRGTCHPPPCAEDRPNELESRVELLQSQLHRLETRMTADIHVILQLLQRQITPVPPAYSTVLPSPHPAYPTTLYSTAAPIIHPVPSIPPIKTDSMPSPLQVGTGMVCR
uniref:Potassium voltage-gated channel, subfamily H (eag-related), member 6a n=1 Tax=Hucho hucho TaxID=62062 RepID=A0A4W5Q734_9TELE